MKNQIVVGYSKNLKNLSQLSGVDACLFSYGCYPQISFASELGGKTHQLLNMANISKTVGGICFFGVLTNTYSLCKKSVVVCDGGKLLGISDANFSFEQNLSTSCGYKIYNSKFGKIGVLCDCDIGFLEGVECLAKCQSRLIIALSGDFCQIPTQIITRAQSYLNGVPICFLNGETCCATSSSGKIAYFGKEQQSKFSLSLNGAKKGYKYKSR